MATTTMNSAAVTAAMANIWFLQPAKDQFTRWQDTTKWFQPRSVRHKGEKLFWKLTTQPYTGVRRTKTGQESEFPEPRQVDWDEFELDKDDIPEFQATIEYTGLAAEKTRLRSEAIESVAQKLVMGLALDFSGQLNVALHQNADCVMAQVVEKFDPDGTTYTSSATVAFLQLDSGSIAQFYKGQILDIREGSDNGDVQVTAQVNDVLHTSKGPQGVVDIGPGIIVTRQSGDADFDNIADDDEIALSGEVASNLTSFPSWFGQTNTVMGIDRTTVGNQWSVPLQEDYTDGSGNPVTFDLEDHLRPAAEQLSLAIRAGRQARVNTGLDGIRMTGALVALSTPKLLSEAVSQAGDPVRFMTKLSSDMDAAMRRELFGDVGFNGVVYHSPLLPPIALQPDPVATPNILRLVEPSSWFYITAHDGGIRQPEKLSRDGRWWRYVQGSNGRPVNQLIAGSLMRVELANDQPQANYQISGIKSALD